MNDAISQINSDSTVAANGAAAANSAIAIANAIKWVFGTTYAIGDARWSPINFQTYRRKTVGAGTTDPASDSTNWSQVVVSNNGGSTTTSSAVDITLTSAANRFQSVSISTTGKAVILPAATTLPTGGEIFAIKNSGTYIFAIRDAGMNLISILQAGQSCLLYLSDNSTANGVWAVGAGATTSLLNAIYTENSAVQITSASTTYLSICSLSSTQAIAVYVVANVAYACTLNISGTTITIGTPIAVATATASTTAITMLTGTTALIAIGKGATTVCGVLTATGTDLAVGVLASINTYPAPGMALAMLTPTKCVMGYVAPTTYYPTLITVNISGTTVTFGATPLTAYSFSNATMQPSIVTINSASVLFTSSPTVTATYSTKFNISADIITAGINANQITTPGGRYASATVVLPNSDISISVVTDATAPISLYIQAGSMSSAKIAPIMKITDVLYNWSVALLPINSSSALLIYRSTLGYVKALKIYVDVVNLTVSSDSFLKFQPLSAVSNNFLSAAAMSANEMIVFANTTSNYSQAQLAEII
jgi:hypothetical protein